MGFIDLRDMIHHFHFSFLWISAESENFLGILCDELKCTAYGLSSKGLSLLELLPFSLFFSPAV